VRAHTILLIGLLSAAAVPAGAQPLARGDVTGTLGWFNANKSEFDSYNDWYNRSAHVGALVGWYWSDHLKTELELGATSRTNLYTSRPLVIDGQPNYISSEHRFSTRRLGIGQQYQFFRNAWAHPHVAAGVDLTWETADRRDQPVVQYDPVSRQTRVLQPAQTIAPSTELHVRPFAEVGTKLYMSRRAFFRTDLRLTFRSRVDEVLMRFGFGVDF
jgi:hypothetical protein